MKKFITLFISLAIILGLSACAPKLKSDELNHNGKIPDGGIYITGNTPELTVNKDGTWTVERNEFAHYYNGGDSFPEIKGGAHFYAYGDYLYEHGFFLLDDNSNKTTSGWRVTVIDDTKTEYGDILETINGAPVIFLNHTFERCINLKVSPKIPETIIGMNSAFYCCTSLTKVTNIPAGVTDLDDAFAFCDVLTEIPTIPSSVVKMNGTFEACFELKKIDIDANPTEFEYCFSLVPKDTLHITGNCSRETKDNLMNTATE